MTAANVARVALIGAGRISDWHVRALRVAELEVSAVSTRPGSVRLEKFAATHGIPNVYDDWRRMLADRTQWDAVLVATHTDGTPEILSAVLDLGVPLLVEKPVAWNSVTLNQLRKRAHARVIVGYNRRFYRTVRTVRDEARGGPPLLLNVSLPEGIRAPADGSPSNEYLRPFFENSCHGIDLLRFLLGDIQVENVQRVRTPHGNLCGLAALLSTARGDVVLFTANWGTPANFSISLNRPGRRLDLLPFELVTSYEGMDVLPPSEKYPIRRYVPKQKDQIFLDEIDLLEKPGFVAQALALRQMIHGDTPPADAATLDDAYHAIRLCEELSGIQFP